MLNKKWSEESRLKVSKRMKGYIWKEESKLKLSKGINQFDKNGLLIETFPGITIAATKFGTKKGTIWRALSGRRKTALGFLWGYK